ncbi:hypothetical protein GGE67_000109 [Rhizobium leucaenae]|uniref:Uncharacterized protein n=1 Tax=Rhizobium leucaenae TaxID=29450 RepID=A0A7W6ZVS0_9HYPH|nr:hypothetical protein [Rhizobium leucaenae]MBB6299516.1 hypothetical protein [Rhizobium leucaenae]
MLDHVTIGVSNFMKQRWRQAGETMDRQASGPIIIPTITALLSLIRWTQYRGRLSPAGDLNLS